MLANARVYQGFAFHNACYEITRAMQSKFFPMRNRITFWPRSCIYDSARAWPLACFKPGFGQQLGKLAALARNAHVPSILYFTLDASLAAHFLKPHMLSILWPARMNTLVGSVQAQRHKRPLHALGIFAGNIQSACQLLTCFRFASHAFDGISRMMRFAYVRKILEKMP